MTSAEFVDLALKMPETETALYYGKPAVKRAGKIMFSYGDDNQISIKLDWDSKLSLLEEYPEVFSVTPHVSTWPWVLVDLERLGQTKAQELLNLSWEDAPKKSKIRPEMKVEG